ncbi:MAG: glycosyltransferase family 4 protein [Cytophaga sp.]|uniref:glycosyltransferase family 4 protein n=1 Tax=Cytophaga sp. TaxID=29535 RepID=UPI003F7F37A0
MKICALTSGITIPSAQYRVRQYIPYLQNKGVLVTEKKPLWNKFDVPSEPYRKVLKLIHSDNPRTWNRLKLLDRYRAVLASNFYSITWIQKVLIPYHFTLELKSSRPIVFDLDDAIWLDEGAGFTDKIVTGADCVFAGNNYLADWVSKYNQNVKIIPTAVDTKIYFPETNTNKNRFVIGWIGTSGNYKYLLNIINALKVFFDKRKDAVLKIIADRYPVELEQISGNIEFVPWHPMGHVQAMRDFSVGIMPMQNDEWTKGKCSFKMLQYMAMGLPVLVSPFGMNKEILGQGDIGLGPVSDNDWYDAIEDVYLNTNTYAVKGINGYTVIENNYSTETVSNEIASQFKRLIQT